LAQGRASL